MNKPPWAVVALATLGVGLFVAGWLVQWWWRPSQLWSRAQAEHHARVSSQLHQITHESAHVIEDTRSTAEEKTKAQQRLGAVKDEFTRSQRALEHAKTWSTRLTRGLHAVGLCALLAAYAVFQVNKGRGRSR